MSEPTHEPSIAEKAYAAILATGLVPKGELARLAQSEEMVEKIAKAICDAVVDAIHKNA